MDFGDPAGATDVLNVAETISLDLAQTLQLVADTIVESLGFEVSVINMVDEEDDTHMVVAAVCGPVELREKLLHSRQGRDGWAKLFAASEPWGRLRFLDHATLALDSTEILTWVPNMPARDDPNAWHPKDALFAPLESADGRNLGVLSVDVPRDGLRPGLATRHALEAFAVTASLAIQHATLAAQSRRDVRRFQAVFDSSPVSIGLLGPDRRFSRVNDALCTFLARDRTELLGHSPLEFTHPLDLPDGRRQMSQIWSDEVVEPPALEKRYVKPDGSTVWGRLHVAPLSRSDEPDVVIAQVEDITERKNGEARLLWQAHFDALTSLLNRSQSMRELREALSTDADAGTTTVVFFCDLDRLKLVNDVHGHAVGDAYIREAGSRIRASVRDTDKVGRLGGDEFVVILQGTQTPMETMELASRVLDRVRQPMCLAGSTFTPSLSLGIAFSTGPSTTADELLAQADAAMYQAKTEDPGEWQVYDTTMRNSAAQQLRLRNDVAAALMHEQFVLHYQPIVRLSDRAVVSREALLRWQHPRRGLLMPDEFLEVVLDSEYESPVTDWVVRQACSDAARRPEGARTVSVNVSSMQVGRRDLPEAIRRSLLASGLDPGDLVLELTEDRLLSRADGAHLLQGLRDLGVSLAIDDFGTGYAGLGYLQRFSSVSTIKLDRSFVAGLGEDSMSEHIVRAMVELARGCKLSLVTEGVETEEQAALLKELGVEFAQGYLFGRPQPELS